MTRHETLTDPRQLAALVELKAVLEQHRVRERDLLRVREVEVARALGVERQAALRLVAKGVRALGVVRLHGLLAVRGGHVVVRERGEQLRDAEGVVVERERAT